MNFGSLKPTDGVGKDRAGGRCCPPSQPHGEPGAELLDSPPPHQQTAPEGLTQAQDITIPHQTLAAWCPNPQPAFKELTVWGQTAVCWGAWETEMG